MKTNFKIAGLVASFLAVASISYSATTTTGNVVRMTASGDTVFANNPPGSPKIRVKEARIVTIAGPKSHIFRANVSSGTGNTIFERYNLHGDNGTTLSASTTGTTTILFPEGLDVPAGGLIYVTDDTSCSIYLVTDKR